MAMADPRRDVADASPVERADIALGEKLASKRKHPAVKAAAKLGEITDQEPLYALSGVVLAVGLITRNPKLAGAGVRLLAAVAAADLAKSAVKNLVTRTRPHVLMDEDRYEADSGGGDEKLEQSFPSGHAAGAAAVARSISRGYPGVGPWAALAAAAGSATRLAKGAHWPLDVAAGVVIGLAAEAVSDFGLRRLVPLPLASTADRLKAWTGPAFDVGWPHTTHRRLESERAFMEGLPHGRR